MNDYMNSRIIFCMLLGLFLPILAICQFSEHEPSFSFEGKVKSCKSIIRYQNGEERWNSVSINISGTEIEFKFCDGTKSCKKIEQTKGKKQINGLVKNASDKTISYSTEIFDSVYGQIVKITQIFTKVSNIENEKKTNYILYEYDTTENKTYITHYREGIPISQTVEMRDYTGLIVKEVLYYFDWIGTENKGLPKGSKCTISNSKSFIYDAKGKLIQTIEYLYGSEGISERKVSYYDKNQRVVRICVFDPDDYINSEIKFSYDSKGMVTHKVFKYFNEGETTTHEERCVLKYDKKGNWINRQTFANGELYYSETREFEYWGE